MTVPAAPESLPLRALLGRIWRDYLSRNKLALVTCDEVQPETGVIVRGLISPVR